MTALRLVLVMFLAGGLGTLVRFGLTRWLTSPLASGVEAAPALYATLVVNAVGCLVAGFCWGAFEARGMLESEWKLVVLVGMLGAWTTFSTYALEAVLIAEGGAWLRALGHVILTNALGLLCLVVGVFCARAVVPTVV